MPSVKTVNLWGYEYRNAKARVGVMRKRSARVWIQIAFRSKEREKGRGQKEQHYKM